MNWEREAVRAYRVRGAAMTVSLLVAFLPLFFAVIAYGTLLFGGLTEQGTTLRSPAEFFEGWGRMNKYLLVEVLSTSPWGWAVFVPFGGLIAFGQLYNAEVRARAVVERRFMGANSNQLGHIEKAFLDLAPNPYHTDVMMERWRREAATSDAQADRSWGQLERAKR